MKIEIPDVVIQRIEENLKEFGEEVMIPKNWNETINYLLVEYFEDQYGIDFDDLVDDHEKSDLANELQVNH